MRRLCFADAAVPFLNYDTLGELQAAKGRLLEDAPVAAVVACEAVRWQDLNLRPREQPPLFKR
jgi:hypothetical protein